MSEFLTKAKEQVLIYWLLGLYILLFSLSALSSCILASLVGSTWKELDGQGKFMIELAVFGNWASIILALLNKTAARLFTKQWPIDPEDQKLISTRTDTSIQQIKTEITNP